MRSSMIRAIGLSLCLAGCLRFGGAQGCGIQMVPHYSAYSTVSNDDTHIYTAVVTDGSATCNPTPSCPCNTATHTRQRPTIFWDPREAGAPATSPDINFAFNGIGEVNCSLAGIFFSQSFVSELLSIHQAYWGHR